MDKHYVLITHIAKYTHTQTVTMIDTNNCIHTIITTNHTAN